VWTVAALGVARDHEDAASGAHDSRPALGRDAGGAWRERDALMAGRSGLTLLRAETEGSDSLHGVRSRDPRSEQIAGRQIRQRVYVIRIYGDIPRVYVSPRSIRGRLAGTLVTICRSLTICRMLTVCRGLTICHRSSTWSRVASRRPRVTRTRITAGRERAEQQEREGLHVFSSAKKARTPSRSAMRRAGGRLLRKVLP